MPVDVSTLEEQLKKAPRHGRNAAWLLLKALDEDTEAPEETPKKAPKNAPAAAPPVRAVEKADFALFNQMPPMLRPNIPVTAKSKISRGPRIQWLNRVVCLYLEFIGIDQLGMSKKADLQQAVRVNASFCRCAVSAAVAHERAAFDRSSDKHIYHKNVRKMAPDLAFVDSPALLKLCTYFQVSPPPGLAAAAPPEADADAPAPAPSATTESANKDVHGVAVKTEAVPAGCEGEGASVGAGGEAAGGPQGDSVERDGAAAGAGAGPVEADVCPAGGPEGRDGAPDAADADGATAPDGRQAAGQPATCDTSNKKTTPAGPQAPEASAGGQPAPVCQPAPQPPRGAAPDAPEASAPAPDDDPALAGPAAELRGQRGPAAPAALPALPIAPEPCQSTPPAPSPAPGTGCEAAAGAVACSAAGAHGAALEAPANQPPQPSSAPDAQPDTSLSAPADARTGVLGGAATPHPAEAAHGGAGGSSGPGLSHATPAPAATCVEKAAAMAAPDRADGPVAEDDAAAEARVAALSEQLALRAARRQAEGTPRKQARVAGGAGHVEARAGDLPHRQSTHRNEDYTVRKFVWEQMNKIVPESVRGSRRELAQLAAKVTGRLDMSHKELYSKNIKAVDIIKSNKDRIMAVIHREMQKFCNERGKGS